MLPTTTAYCQLNLGGLAQLARALDLHSRGHRFDSDILHKRSLKLRPKVSKSKVTEKEGEDRILLKLLRIQKFIDKEGKII